MRKARSQDLSFCRKTLRTVATESLRCRGKLQQTAERRPRLQIPRIKEITPKKPKKKERTHSSRNPSAHQFHNRLAFRKPKDKNQRIQYMSEKLRSRKLKPPRKTSTKNKGKKNRLIYPLAAAAEKATTTQQRTDDDKDANNGRYAQRRSAIARAPLSLSRARATTTATTTNNDDEKAAAVKT